MEKASLNKTLLVAVSSGHANDVASLLSAGADPNARDKKDWPPLYTSIIIGNVEIVTALLSAGADPNVQAANGWTPLHYAAAVDNAEAVTALLSAGADPTARNVSGDPPHVLAPPATHAVFDAYQRRRELTATTNPCPSSPQEALRPRF